MHDNTSTSTITINGSGELKQLTVIPSAISQKELREKRKIQKEAHDFYYNALEMDDNEFQKLVINNGVWIESPGVHSSWKVEEQDRCNAMIYVVTYGANKPGMITTAFYIRYKSRVFRCRCLNGIEEIISKLKIFWNKEYEGTLKVRAYWQRQKEKSEAAKAERLKIRLAKKAENKLLN